MHIVLYHGGHKSWRFSYNVAFCSCDRAETFDRVSFSSPERGTLLCAFVATSVVATVTLGSQPMRRLPLDLGHTPQRRGELRPNPRGVAQDESDSDSPDESDAHEEMDEEQEVALPSQEMDEDDQEDRKPQATCISSSKAALGQGAGSLAATQSSMLHSEPELDLSEPELNRSELGLAL